MEADRLLNASFGADDALSSALDDDSFSVQDLLSLLNPYNPVDDLVTTLSLREKDLAGQVAEINLETGKAKAEVRDCVLAVNAHRADQSGSALDHKAKDRCLTQACEKAMEHLTWLNKCRGLEQEALQQVREELAEAKGPAFEESAGLSRPTASKSMGQNLLRPKAAATAAPAQHKNLIAPPLAPPPQLRATREPPPQPRAALEEHQQTHRAEECRGALQEHQQAQERGHQPDSKDEMEDKGDASPDGVQRLLEAAEEAEEDRRVEAAKHARYRRSLENKKKKIPDWLMKEISEGKDYYDLWCKYGGDWVEVSMEVTMINEKSNDTTDQWETMMKKDIEERYKHCPAVAEEIIAHCKENGLVIPHPQAPANEDAAEFKVWKGQVQLLSTKATEQLKMSMAAEIDPEAGAEYRDAMGKLREAIRPSDKVSASAPKCIGGAGDDNPGGAGGKGGAKRRKAPKVLTQDEKDQKKSFWSLGSR